MKFCHKILLYTDYNLNEILNNGIDPHKITVINNTINEIPHIKAAKSVTANQLNLVTQQTRASKHTLLFIGRLTRAKRPDLLIPIAKKLLGVFPDLRLIVIGDGEEKNTLEAKIHKNGLERNIFLLGAITDPKQLAPYMKSADFSILPGAVGLSIVHSFIYGLPFVTLKDAPHGPEIAYLKSGENGYFAEDITDLSNWLIRSFNNPEQIKIMKKNCELLIQKQVTLENMIKNFINALQ